MKILYVGFCSLCGALRLAQVVQDWCAQRGRGELGDAGTSMGSQYISISVYQLYQSGPAHACSLLSEWVELITWYYGICMRITHIMSCHVMYGRVSIFSRKERHDDDNLVPYIQVQVDGESETFD